MKRAIWNILIPLLITVLGGIAVLLYSEYLNSNEEFGFAVESTGLFRSSDKLLSSYKIEVYNTLPQKLTDTEILINLSAPVDEVKIGSSNLAKAASEWSIDQSGQKLSIPIGLLRSGQNEEVQVFFASQTSISVTVAAQSLERVAVPESSPKFQFESKQLILAFLLLVIIYGTYISYRMPRIFKDSKLWSSPIDLDSKSEPSTSLNNSAFVLLHSGEAATALKILEEALLKGEGDSNVLSNIALCYCLLGNEVKAGMNLDAAAFLCKENPEEIYQLNKGLIQFFSGKEIEAKQTLEAFMTESPKEFAYYKKYSKLLSDATEGFSTDVQSA